MNNFDGVERERVVRETVERHRQEILRRSAWRKVEKMLSRPLLSHEAAELEMLARDYGFKLLWQSKSIQVDGPATSWHATRRDAQVELKRLESVP